MNEFQLNQALDSLFRDLDTAPDFDARFLSRLASNSPADFAEAAARARQVERERYRTALSRSRSVRRAKLRVLTLDGFGIACLVAVAVASAWRDSDINEVQPILQFLPYLAVGFGAMVAALPLIGMWIERSWRIRDIA